MRLFESFMGARKKRGDAVVHVATDPELETTTGRYFKEQEMTDAAPAARDRELAADLWEVTAELTGLDAAWPGVEEPAP